MNTLALITIMAWPVIPLFWIPVHLFSDFFKKIKLLTYLLPLVTWVPIAAVLYQNKTVILSHTVAFPAFVQVIGAALLIAGTVLHIWTGKLLTLWGIVGVSEIYGTGSVMRSGAFGVIRHPTYLAHTAMFSGVFLMTGVLAAAGVTVMDLLLVHLLIIPLEEKELISRFGEEYKKYRRQVPKFIPRL